jgi:microcystin-dependent protein
MFWGQGAGLSLYDQGQAGGVESVTLLESEIPTHTHAVRADGLNQADQAVPNPNRVLAVANGGKVYQNPAQPQSPMHIQSLSIAGGSLPHNNMMPYLVVNFCIAMQGIFPPRG